MRLRFFFLSSLICSLLFVISCGGGGDASTNDSGTVTMSVTDAKPSLPENASSLFITFSEVWVHKAGEGWIELGLVDENPYTIDLLQFYDGTTTELVPPTKLSSGKYTQVRIAIDSATIRFDIKNEAGEVVDTRDETLEIPSENLKTDKNFTIDLEADSAMDIVIHFDLSMSVVVSGTESDPTYSLKPVIHLFEDPQQAATIEGYLSSSSFVGSNSATIIVLDGEQEEFTRVEVEKESDTDPTWFSIFWLVPNKPYEVQIDFDPTNDAIDYDEIIQSDDLYEGATFELNTGEEI